MSTLFLDSTLTAISILCSNAFNSENAKLTADYNCIDLYVLYVLYVCIVCIELLITIP